MALYRDYRPQVFEDVIGQDEAVTSLQASLESGKLGHAVVFSGPHGVGKTTLARLVAQCLCCEKAPTSSPCGECPSCKAFLSSNHPDLLEMDAASNRGVDDARAIRERLAVAPMLSSATVLIIDEAHMLTREAQNALLKTLEEPPPGVYFLFATTAADKLLNTIRSRCQQYLLRTPTQAQLRESLEKVAKAEGIEYDSEAIDAICEAAAGSYRDGLSLLDQAWSSSQGKLSADQVRRSSGIPGPDTWQSICEAVADGDAGRAMASIATLTTQGFDMKSSLGELERFLRLVLYAQSGGIPETLRATPHTSQAAEEVASRLPAHSLWTIISGIESAYQSAAFGGSAALAIENTLSQAAAQSGSSPPKQQAGGEPPKAAEPPAQAPRGQAGGNNPADRAPTDHAADSEIGEQTDSDPDPTPAADPQTGEGAAEAPELKEQLEQSEQAPPEESKPDESQATSIDQTAELPGPAVAAAAFPLLRLALRTHYPEHYLVMRTAWARYDDKRLVLQMESPLNKQQSAETLSVIRRMVDGSVRITSRQREEVKKGRPAGSGSKVKPAADRGSLLASMGLIPLEGERRSEQEGLSQDQFGPDA